MIKGGRIEGVLSALEIHVIPLIYEPIGIYSCRRQGAPRLSTVCREPYLNLTSISNMVHVAFQRAYFAHKAYKIEEERREIHT